MAHKAEASFLHSKLQEPNVCITEKSVIGWSITRGAESELESESPGVVATIQESESESESIINCFDSDSGTFC